MDCQDKGFNFNKENRLGNNIVTAKVSIEGVRPLLWHAFGPDALPLEKQERTGVAGNDPEEWRKTVLMTKERQLYIPPEYIFSMCRDAAKHTRKGKGSIQALVGATLLCTDDIILVDRYVPEEPIPIDRDEPVYIYICGVRNPSTKGRNVRYRIAARAGWNMTFNLQWDKTIVATEQMKAVLNDAGVLVGLADGRSVGYGRFTVRECQIGAV